MALASTAAVVHGVLEVTIASGGSELALVAAQDEIAHPSRTVRQALAEFLGSAGLVTVVMIRVPLVVHEGNALPGRRTFPT